ncbi:MAG: hypothetical protein H6Q41_4453 [Deltaproteobacteria bacterium]|jgi:hypothetical protein|nr:hypothetical protein [Deltaproteobacteria bacterium]
MKKKLYTLLAVFVVALTMALPGPGTALAHCDGLDGPVIVDAKKALESGDVNLILIWVQKKDEAEIKKAFQKTLAVRKLNPEAKELADMYFFETLVRVHRAGEGEPYTGIKPAGRDLGPAIPAGDKAVADGKLDPLYRLLTERIHDGLHQKFELVMKKKNFRKDDVQAGREYVEAYVPFIHYVEALYEITTKGAHGHSPEAEKGEGHKH